MEFTISKAAFEAELAAAMAVIEKKSTIPILSYVLIRANGTIELAGTDHTIEIRAVSQSFKEIKDQGECCIEAGRLYGWLKTLPTDADLRFVTTDNRILVQAGRAKAQFATLPAKDFIKLPETEESETIKITAGQLLSFIDHTLNGAKEFALFERIEGKDSELIRMISFNNKGLYVIGTGSLADTTKASSSLLIPAKSLRVIRALAGACEPKHTVTIEMDKHHFKIDFGMRSIISQVGSGAFPNYRMVVGKEDYPITAVIDKDELLSAIERVAIMSETGGNDDKGMTWVNMSFVSGGLKVYGVENAYGVSESLLSVDYKGAAFEESFQASFLLDVLRICRSKQIRFQCEPERSVSVPSKWTPISDSGYQFIVMVAGKAKGAATGVTAGSTGEEK